MVSIYERFKNDMERGINPRGGVKRYAEKTGRLTPRREHISRVHVHPVEINLRNNEEQRIK